MTILILSIGKNRQTNPETCSQVGLSYTGPKTNAMATTGCQNVYFPNGW